MISRLCRPAIALLHRVGSVSSVSAFHGRVAEIARMLRAEQGTRATLQRGVEVATELIDGCDHACVSLVNRKHQIETPASTSKAAAHGDELQYELDEGPCLDAIRFQETVWSRDLSREDRWPSWGPRMAKNCGIRSMLCYQLFIKKESLGALNLYSETVDAFDEHDRAVGWAYAAHVAVALAGAQEIDQLQTAIGSRTRIGQAEGILMERFQLSPEQAFDVLRRYSQGENIKLSVVAARLVSSRKLPDEFAEDHPASLN